MRLGSTLLVAALAAATLATLGCMVGEVTHTVYLEPDGSMTWIVEESWMRSAEDDPRARRSEESEWLAARVGETHAQAEAFWQLGAARVETLVVRDRRPFQVVTRATFRNPADALERLFHASGLRGEIELAGDRRAGAIAIAIDVEGSQHDGGNEIGAVGSLLSFDRLRLMVSDGRFVDAVGLELDGDTAWLDERGMERAFERDPSTLRLSLAWVHDRR
ncbi:MAG TPA: hypothetical protein VMV46_21400 [Thermoanaerobaculia bacterium]|nr:hypothetical protein [Thermoanaerobaculia bacterium]